MEKTNNNLLNNKNQLFRQESIFSNCNSTLKAMDFNSKLNILAFCSSNLIHIYDFNLEKSIFTLKAHKERINSLKWLINDTETRLLSISSDRSCFMW